MTWLPFGSDKMIEVDMQTSAHDGIYDLTVRCVSSQVGDTNRFCYLVGSNVLWVASPMDDDGVPVYPAFNAEGATRTRKIKVTCDVEASVEETVTGVLNDLDEYIRSKEALKDMVDAEVFVVRP